MRLTTGAVVRGLRTERTATHVTVISAEGRVSFPVGKVASVREVAAETAPRRRDATTVGEGDAPAERALASAASPGSDLPEGPAWAALRGVAAILAEGRLADAEAEARRLAIAHPDEPAAAIAVGEILLGQARHDEAVRALRPVGTAMLPAPLLRARNLALAEALLRLQRADEADALLASTPDDAAGRVRAARAGLQPDLSMRDRELGSSDHFAVVALPGANAQDVAALLDELEAMHARLKQELGGAPRDRIGVVLHPGSEFWEATGMGREVGALYDGRMRVPAQRMGGSASVSAALRHEMTHAFVEALTAGRADVRWHEGLAEHFEGSDARPTRRLLAAQARGGGEWPPPATHANSHVRLEWFLGRWGMAGVRGVLSGLATRGTIDAALRSVTGLGESELDEAWRRDLAAEKP